MKFTDKNKVYVNFEGSFFATSFDCKSLKQILASYLKSMFMRPT